MRWAAALAAACLAWPATAADEQVRFPSRDIELAGTLSLPDGLGPYTALILVSGSGPSDRDESIEGVGLKPFAAIAQHLSASGIAVLRYDDRGVGESGGTYGSPTLDDFAADAAAALDFLKTREEVRGDAIGILGHSEGGMVAPMVAISRPGEVAFVVVLAAPAVNGHAFLAGQIDTLMATASPEQKVELLSQREALDLVQAEDWAGAEANLRRSYRLANGGHGGSEDQYIAGGLGFFKGWLQSFVVNKPAENWVNVNVPVLALYGERDAQVSSQQNAPALETALGGNPDAMVIRVPAANHLFQEASTGAISEYPALPAAFAPGVLPTLTEWILKRFGAR